MENVEFLPPKETQRNDRRYRSCYLSKIITMGSWAGLACKAFPVKPQGSSLKQHKKTVENNDIT